MSRSKGRKLRGNAFRKERRLAKRGRLEAAIARHPASQSVLAVAPVLVESHPVKVEKTNVCKRCGAHGKSQCRTASGGFASKPHVGRGE